MNTKCAVTNQPVQDEPKYPLPALPDYTGEIEAAVKALKPPEFSTQGEAAGKTRGRKPKKASPKAKAKTGAKRATGRETKSSGTRGANPRAKAKAAPKAKSAAKRARSVRPKTSEPPAATEDAVPAHAEPKRRSRARKPAASVPAAPADDREERVPPPHVTHNHIYSSAYRKALSQVPNDVENAKSQGNKAVDYFKVHGKVNYLCGKFRENPRKKGDVPKES